MDKLGLKNSTVGRNLLPRLIRVVPLAIWFGSSIMAFACVIGVVDFRVLVVKMKSFHQLNTWVSGAIEVIFFARGKHLRPFPRAGVLIRVFDAEIRHSLSLD